MANYPALIKVINNQIKANGNQEITGPVLNAVLQAIVSGMSEGALYAGIANTTTNPPAYDGNVFYIAIEPGAYSNFGVIVPRGSIGIIYNTSSGWAVTLINTYYEIDVDTLMQDSPSSDDIDEAIGGLSNLKRAIIAGVPFFGRSASGDNTVAIAQVEQLSANEVRVVMLNTGTIDGSNELVPIIKKITVSAGQLSLSTEAPTSFIGPLSSLSTNEKGSVVGAINEVNTGLKSAVKPYVVDLTDLLAAQDSESISTAIGGIDNLNGTVQKNQVIFGILANGTVAVGIRVLGNQTTLTYFVDSVVGLTVNDVIITNTSGTLTKTVNTHAVLTENMVVNNLESDEATLPLSAAQGKVLATDKQDKLKAGTGVEITSDNTVNVTLDTTVFKVVASLPESPAAGDENKIFLVPAESTEEGNIYTEYVFVNGKWEEFGTYRSEVDLTPYLKKADAEATYQKITDNTLATTDKTVVGAINENTGNVTRIDRAVGNPTVEEYNFTVAESRKIWTSTGQKVSSSNWFISEIINISKGDAISFKTSGASGDISAITKVSASGEFINAVVLMNADMDSVYWVADEDSHIQVTIPLSLKDNPYTIIKSPFNAAISDNSYMQYLHKVYEEYGAVYNEETGYWEYGDLKDMTEEDCFLAAFYALEQIQGEFPVSFILDRFGIRQARTYFTIINPKGGYLGTRLYLNSCFAVNSRLEYLKLSTNPTSPYLYIKNMEGAFRACAKLRKIEDILTIFNRESKITDAFSGCVVLKDVKIKLNSGANVNISFKFSPILSYESIKYLVDNAANTSAITVTVHPTTYSYLTGTAQPTEEVGGTTDEWQALVTTAQGKQITFAVAEDSQTE